MTDVGPTLSSSASQAPVIASDSEAIQTKPQLETPWIASLRSQ
jgi:hypothetical protein